MPCAEGELCLVQVSSPEGRDGHGCQGTCGGRLHGTCGSVVGDNEMHRICSKCLDQKGKRKKGSPDSEVEAEGDEENEEEDDESTGRGRGAPPSYGELSSHFGILERAAQDSGNADAALYLSKARMAMIAAYANNRTRQADLREFVSTE